MPDQAKVKFVVDWFKDHDPEDRFDASDFLPRPTPTSGEVWLTWLADTLRAAGLNVVEYPNWKSRARSSGGYDPGKPYCVMWHHTASGRNSDGQNDADYIAEGDEDAPLANLYIDRSGTVWVIAAGATNTNGKGRSMTFSRGTVPADSMNTHAVGIEMGNDGVGELWPQAQIDSAFLVSNIVNGRLGNLPDDVGTHQFYAPDRKIDPAVAWAVEGPWQPDAVTASGTWELGDIQAECRNRWGLPPQPQPSPPGEPAPKDDDDMRLYAFLDDVGTVWLGNGIDRFALTGMDQFNHYMLLSSTGGGPMLITANGIQVKDIGQVAYGTPGVIDALGKVRQ